VPKLSIIVIFYNMQREAKRTLLSLSTAYQTGVQPEEYEVIAIDNASTEPLSADEVTAFGPNFRYHFHETSSVSPVGAVNAGVDMTTGDYVAAIIDGARMATPGLIQSTLTALKLVREPFVSALSWHLGPDMQRKSMNTGYDQAQEDRLLESIEWPTDGYKLFEISTIAPSSKEGFFGDVPPECSWFAMPRTTYLKLGGFEPRFVSPGGGYMNHDFRNRALKIPNVKPINLLGEGVFHQFHGGVSTNAKDQVFSNTLDMFRTEYEAIRTKGRIVQKSPPALYFGNLPEAARRFTRSSS
jgi:glycosyltransferase involved in cell wall biosynthesis